MVFELYKLNPFPVNPGFALPGKLLIILNLKITIEKTANKHHAKTNNFIFLSGDVTCCSITGNFILVSNQKPY